MFKALRVIINPDDDAIRHIETTVLPYLLENKHMYLALDYARFFCDYLETKERGTKLRAYELLNTVRTITDIMHKGGVIE